MSRLWLAPNWPTSDPPHQARPQCSRLDSLTFNKDFCSWLLTACTHVSWNYILRNNLAKHVSRSDWHSWGHLFNVIFPEDQSTSRLCFQSQVWLRINGVFPRQVMAHQNFSACFPILMITEMKWVVLPVWFLVPLTFSTGMGFFKDFNSIHHSRAQLLSMKHLVAPLSSNASTLMGKAGPWILTGTFTSLSMVTDLLSSRTGFLGLTLLGLLELSWIDRFSLGPIGDSKRGCDGSRGGRVLARGTGSCT